MTGLTLFEGVSLVELIIASFIGANFLLSGAFVLQTSVRKFSQSRSED